MHLASPEPAEQTAFDLPDDPDRPSQVVEISTPPGTFFDSRSTLHLLSGASLRSAKALHATGDWNPRRFRPNLLLRADGGGYPEDEWVQRPIRIGRLDATVRKASTRCVLVAQPQPTQGLARDSSIFRALARERAGNLGIYVDPTGAGAVHVGDAVEVLG